MNLDFANLSMEDQICAGAIVFHGWEEIRYKENYSIQFKPGYGWSKHT